jgi:hypothetical protein
MNRVALTCADDRIAARLRCTALHRDPPQRLSVGLSSPIYQIPRLFGNSPPPQILNPFPPSVEALSE